MNVLLCVVVIVIGLGVFIGYKQGLIKMIASLLATTLIISLVGFVSPYVSRWIQRGTPLKKSVQAKVVKMLVTEEGEKEKEDILEKDIVREEQISLLENAEIPETFRQSLLENNNHEAYAMLGVKTFGEYVGTYITKVIADVLAFLISFVIVSIAVAVLIKLLGVIDKLPLIGGMNRVAGGLMGTVIGVAGIWMLFLIITVLYDTSIGQLGFKQIEESKILSYLYENNLFIKYITKF